MDNVNLLHVAESQEFWIRKETDVENDFLNVMDNLKATAVMFVWIYFLGCGVLVSSCLVFKADFFFFFLIYKLAHYLDIENHQLK